MTNLHVKYEDFEIHSIQDNQRKPFYHSKSLWSWPSNPKINRGHLLVLLTLILILNYVLSHFDVVVVIVEPLPKHIKTPGAVNPSLWHKMPYFKYTALFWCISKRFSLLWYVYVHIPYVCQHLLNVFNCIYTLYPKRMKH